MLAEVLEENEQKTKGNNEEEEEKEKTKKIVKMEEERKEKERQQAQLSSSQERSKMFVKEEMWYRLFPFMDIMMTFFSALSCRDSINITLLSLGVKPDSSIGVGIQWIYAICTFSFGSCKFF
ncbi:hypothetical protein RFI_16709 [Reticulomyxa filosa]|uniref:Uncharacterized protein n=1 Tax=Reticulomyxa filosa TaxID=46433 RepID=X6N368_RETFI|nr:hypothetical protein RFI_16709 [Reticulomyxa filosa]|eukprot:ETO20506.1 hypothetical protein RFI_16709 [Reticulomyxa filosa]